MRVGSQKVHVGKQPPDPGTPKPGGTLILVVPGSPHKARHLMGRDQLGDVRYTGRSGSTPDTRTNRSPAVSGYDWGTCRDSTRDSLWQSSQGSAPRGTRVRPPSQSRPPYTLQISLLRRRSSSDRQWRKLNTLHRTRRHGERLLAPLAREHAHTQN